LLARIGKVEKMISINKSNVIVFKRHPTHFSTALYNFIAFNKNHLKTIS